MDNAQAFVIENGTLIEYTGSDPVAIIPQGVHALQEGAFFAQTHLKRVVIPQGITWLPERVRSVEFGAFRFCEELVLSGPADSYGQSFACENGILFMVD